MDEHFTCQACGTNAHIRYLRHRHTMPGDYCKACARFEKCAACGELEPAGTMEWEGSPNGPVCAICINENALVWAAEKTPGLHPIKPAVQLPGKNYRSVA